MQEVHALLKAIDVYFDVIYYCDVDKLDEVFHESSSLYDADQGSIFVDPIASFRADVGSRPAPADRRQRRSDRILAIDWLSDRCAVVKLRLQSHEQVFVDHLAFVKGEGGWRIVAKIWHQEGTADVEVT